MNFKIGDTVYHYEFGKGVVTCTNRWIHEVNFDNGCYNQPVDVKFLSFTPYTLQGFTQERPHEYKKGDLVLCCHDVNALNPRWFIRFYSHTESNNRYHVSSFEDLTLDNTLFVKHIKPYKNV